MPMFAGLMASLFGSLVSFFMQFMTKKLAVTVSLLSALTAITGVLLAAFNAIVSPLAASVFSTDYGQFLGLAFPPVSGNCLAAMGATWAACTLYGWQLRAMSVVVQA